MHPWGSLVPPARARDDSSRKAGLGISRFGELNEEQSEITLHLRGLKEYCCNGLV